MMDIRTKSLIQKMATKIDTLSEDVERLKELLDMNLETSRAIKTSLVRKYKRASNKEE